MEPTKPAVSKWLLVTLIAVAVIGAGFFSWYFLMGPGKKTTTIPTATTTTDKTAGWKTYTGIDYTIKYPKDYVYKDSKLDVNAESNILFAPDNTELDKSIDFSWISVKKTKNSTAINNLKSEAKTGTVGDYNVQASSTKVDQVAATKATFTKSDKSGFEEILVEKNDALFVLQISSLETARLSIFDTMISTFKFTAASTTTTTPDPTADWKTFSDEGYGFTFKYPNDWTVSATKETDSSPVEQKRVKITTLDGAIYEFQNPSTPMGFEDADLVNPKTLTTTEGLEFSRNYGIDNAAIKQLYLATHTDERNVDDLSVLFYGHSITLDAAELEVLDNIVKSFKFSS